MLDIRNVSKRYLLPGGGGNDVLRGASMLVPPGQLAAVTGGNGSGKSTLLAIIAGEIAADGGDVLIDNRSVIQLAMHVRCRTIGYVHQDSYKSVAGDLAAGEVLALASRRASRLRLMPMTINASIDAIRQYSKEAADFIAEHAKTPTKQLSGGQRQLLSLVAALAGTPSVVLLDEHQSSLDDQHARVADILVGAFVRDRPAAGVVVSHDFGWVAQNADLRFELQQGRLKKTNVLGKAARS